MVKSNFQRILLLNDSCSITLFKVKDGQVFQIRIINFQQPYLLRKEINDRQNLCSQPHCLNKSSHVVSMSIQWDDTIKVTLSDGQEFDFYPKKKEWHQNNLLICKESEDNGPKLDQGLSISCSFNSENQSNEMTMQRLIKLLIQNWESDSVTLQGNNDEYQL